MNDTFQGKAALVTGGSRGIGRAIALELATRGAKVAIGYVRNNRRAEEVVNAIASRGGRAEALKADLSQPTEVARLLDEAEQKIGRLDIVVASAAEIIIKPLVDCSEEDYDRIFSTNAKGVFF